MTTQKAYSPETINEVESVESILLLARDIASSSAMFCACNAAIGAMWQAVAKRTLIEVSCANAFCSASEAIEKVGPSFGVALSRIEESSAFAKQFVYDAAKENRG